MRFLAFADVLGDPHAAQAIVMAAKTLIAKGGDLEVVCLGNALGPGSDPALAIERLRKARVHLIRGAWDAAALNMPGPADLRIQAKDIAAKLKPTDLAWLREASPPRRLVAGGKRILLTSDAAPDAGAADVVLHAGPKQYAKRDATTSRLDACTGRANDAPQGESPYVLFDADTGDAKVQYAAWDRTVLRRTRAG